jgi:cysteine synthase A
MLESLGGEVVLVPQVDGAPGQVTGNDIAAAAQLLNNWPRTVVDSTSTNSTQTRDWSREIGTARELIEVAGSRIDGWVACVGTGSTFVGGARGLRAACPHVVMAPVEPSGCEVLAGKPITKRKHLLQGTGYGFVPPHCNPRLVSRCLAVTDDEALAWKRRLAGEEGLHVGFSATANVCAATKLLSTGAIPSDGTVATVLCDSGMKY